MPTAWRAVALGVGAAVVLGVSGAEPASDEAVEAPLRERCCALCPSRQRVSIAACSARSLRISACVVASAASRSARAARADSAASFRFSMAASIFAFVASGIDSKPAGSSGITTEASPFPSSDASPTVPEFLSLAHLPRYAPASWYITPRSVSDPPPSASFRRATRCRVMPRNRLRSASNALMIMPSYSTICSALGAPSESESSSAISSCGLRRAMSRENPTKPVKSSRTSSTSLPSPRAPSATANAAHVAAYRSARDASGAHDTTVKSTAPCSSSVANAAAPESAAAAPTAPYTQRTASVPAAAPVPTRACATTAFKPSSERFVPTSPVSSMHCPLPTGVSTSSGFTPVTSGVLMGLRSSTLGGSRKSSDPLASLFFAASRNGPFGPPSPGTEPPSSGSPSGPIRRPITSRSGGM